MLNPAAAVGQNAERPEPRALHLDQKPNGQRRGGAHGAESLGPAPALAPPPPRPRPSSHTADPTRLDPRPHPPATGLQKAPQ